MPLKVGFEHIVRNRIICNRNNVGQYFLNILSGNKDFTKKILNTNTLGFERAFFANSYLQMFVFHHFLPQK